MPHLLPFHPILSSLPRNPNLHNKPPPSPHHLKAKQTLTNPPSPSPPLLQSPSTPLLPTQALALVAAAQANFLRVVVHAPPSRSGLELLCVVRAVLKKMKRRVLVGDKVLVSGVDWVDGRGMVEEVFERWSEVGDPAVANVEQLVVVFAMREPEVEGFVLTRFLVEAESTGIPVVVVINKMELASEEELSSWKTRFLAWGYQPLFCSVERKEGLNCIEDVLKGKTTVIVGPSGVGKSSLINAIRDTPGNASLNSADGSGNSVGQKWHEHQRVGSVSKRSGRGKHTTRHVSLLPLSGGGYLADTPGFNQPSLLKVTKRSLAETFPEIRQKLSASESSKCAFNDCLHVGEPGCVVNGDWERYPYYLQLLEEIKTREDLQLRTLGTKQEGDVRYKTGIRGKKQAEPRLEPKKHRRVSRKRLNQSIMDELEEEY